MPDTLTIKSGKVRIKTEEGKTVVRPEADLEQMFRKEIASPIDGCALPDGVKFIEWQDPFLVVVHQHPPFCRLLRWIADDSLQNYGPGTKYLKRRLSMPYTVTIASYYHKGGILSLTSANELYFRNAPLHSLNDDLCFPALLNVSVMKANNNRLRTWICTQYLANNPAKMDWTDQLGGLITHTWDGAFNRSSERHEGQSYYGYSKDVHKDLDTVEKWEKASAKDNAFALSVNWKPAPLSIGETVKSVFESAKESVGMGKTVSQSITQRFLKYTAQQK